MDIKCTGNIIYNGEIRPRGMVLKDVPDDTAKALIEGGEAVLPKDKLLPPEPPKVKEQTRRPGYGPRLPERKSR